MHSVKKILFGVAVSIAFLPALDAAAFMRKRSRRLGNADAQFQYPAVGFNDPITLSPLDDTPGEQVVVLQTSPGCMYHLRSIAQHVVLNWGDDYVQGYVGVLDPVSLVPMTDADIAAIQSKLRIPKKEFNLINSESLVYHAKLVRQLSSQKYEIEMLLRAYA
jgi:hypothetical protein